MYVVHGLKIAVKTMSVNLFIAGRSCYGNFSKLLPGLDIRDVDLNLDDIFKALKCIMDSITLMGICSGIYDNPFCAIAVSLLKPVDNGSLMV